MDDIGHDFLADATLAGDQHAGLGRGNQRRVAKNGLHQRAVGDDVIRQRLVPVEV